MKRVATFLLTLLCSAEPLLAWGEKGHRLASEAATWNVPAELPAFFHRAYPRLIYMGYDPDRWRGGGRSLAAVNPPNHFLDFEYVEHLELPPDRYLYLSLLESSGTLTSLGIANTTPGFLPWKVAELYDLLRVQWRLWRASGDELIAREQIEANIIAIAGELGHYVADAGNPHHASIHYNGWAAPQPEEFECSGTGERIICAARNPLPFDCETHSRFESQFVSRAIWLDDVIPYVAEPQIRDDAFEAILELLRDSKATVRHLYELDRARAFDHEGTAEGRELAVRRIAAGSSLLRDLWWSSWRASGSEPAQNGPH